VFTRLSVNCFGDDSPAQLAAAVDAAVERSRVALLGAEAAAAGGCLDLVQLAWLDYKVRAQQPCSSSSHGMLDSGLLRWHAAERMCMAVAQPCC
jgi:hypothetical protein